MELGRAAQGLSGPHVAGVGAVITGRMSRRRQTGDGAEPSSRRLAMCDAHLTTTQSRTGPSFSGGRQWVWRSMATARRGREGIAEATHADDADGLLGPQSGNQPGLIQDAIGDAVGGAYSDRR